MGRIALIFAAVLLASGGLQAKGASDEMLQFFAEEAEVVTASRRPEPLELAPSDVDVVTERQIRDSGARTLSDVLETLPGVQISKHKNGQDKVWIRGGSSVYNDKTLLLIDGFPLREVVYGQHPIDERVPLVDVKRIEVVKGPGSVVYGADAFAGVINVITKGPADAGNEVVAGFGSWNTQSHGVLAGKTFENGGASFWGSFLDTKGPPHDLDEAGSPTGKRDPKRSLGLGAKLLYRDFTFAARRTEYKTDYFSMPDAKRQGLRDETTLLQLGWRHGFGERLTLSARSFYNTFDDPRERRDYQADLVTLKRLEDTSEKTRAWGAGFQGEYSRAESHSLVAGFDYSSEQGLEINRTQFDATAANPAKTLIRWTTPGRPSLDDWAVFAQDTWEFHPKAGLVAGVRHDRQDQYGGQTHPRLALILRPVPELTAKAIYGTAYRAPSIRELYVHETPRNIDDGNPALRPEKLENYELSLKYSPLPNFQAGLAVYRITIRDFIAPDPVALQYGNLGDYRIVGAEPELAWRWSEGHSAFINYTLLRARDGRGDDMPDMAKEMLNLGLNVAAGRHLNVNAALNHSGRRTRPAGYQSLVSDANKSDHLGGYDKVNLTLTSRGMPWEVSLSVHNLFDAKTFNPYYSEMKFDLERPGRSFLVRARRRF